MSGFPVDATSKTHPFIKSSVTFVYLMILALELGLEFIPTRVKKEHMVST